MEILIFLVLFVVSVVLLLITAIKHFLLRKEHREIIENVKKVDFVKRINKYVKILLIIYLVFFISMYALIVINEFWSSQNNINDSDELYLSKALQDTIKYTNTDNRHIYESLITTVQLFILIYVPTRVIANIILIRKLSKNDTLNENEKSIFKKYLIDKIIFNLCIGFIIFFIVVMIKIILSWAGC